MRKLLTLTAAAALVVAFGFAGTAQAGPNNSQKDDPKIEEFELLVLEGAIASESASHFVSQGGDGINAGVIASSSGIKQNKDRNDPDFTGDLDDVIVEVSSSWDWGLFRSSESSNAIELEAHPCALVNTTGHTFSDANAADGSAFTTDATVAITQDSDVIEANITGGFVCEISVFTCNVEIIAAEGGNEDGVCDEFETCFAFTATINESVTTFAVDGGASLGRFAGATGTGSIHSIFNFCTATQQALSEAPPADLDDAFELNEMSLKVVTAD